MGLHRSALNAFESEKAKQTIAPRSEDEVNHSLMNTYDEGLYRSKAMCVWWMLRDMVGDQPLKNAFALYRPERGQGTFLHAAPDPGAEHSAIWSWFFDDWVYRDRGLPDFKVASAFTRKTSPDNYLLTITVDNLGAAGAEVPVTVKFAGGEVTKNAGGARQKQRVIRVEVPKPPEEIVVNDGSVPESDTTNNVFKIEGDAAKVN